MIINLRAVNFDKLHNPIISDEYIIFFYKIVSNKSIAYYIHHHGIEKDILTANSNPKNRTEVIMLALKYFPNAKLSIS